VAHGTEFTERFQQDALSRANAALVPSLLRWVARAAAPGYHGANSKGESGGYGCGERNTRPQWRTLWGRRD
jgi:hypothetical protein